MLIINFIIFLFAILFLITLPGIFLLEKIKEKFNFWEKVTLGTVIGLVLFTILSYFLLILNIRFLLLPIIIFISFLQLKNIKKLLSDITLPNKFSLIILFLVFFTGVIGQLAVIVPSGTMVNNDLVFWSAHGHDGIWHIALIEEIKKGLPLQNPVISNTKLVNYHFFSDIPLADFSRYFGFSALDLFFRFFPFIFSLLLGSLSYLIGKKIGGTFSAGIWSIIFSYFAGSFGFVVTFLHNKTIAGESLFWSSQIQSVIGNPPQILAIIILLTFLYLFPFLLKKTNIFLFLICVLLIGSLAEIKIYANIVLLSALGLVALIQLIKERRINILLLSIVGGVFSLILYLPNSSKSTSFLIWEPWWFVRTLVVANDKLNWINLEYQRQTYIADHNWKRVIQVEAIAFFIFLFGNLGMRFLGIWQFIKTFKNLTLNYFNQLFILIIVTSFLLPMFFLQKGVASNTSQFLQYFLLLFGILSGVAVAQVIDKIKPKLIKITLSLVIIALAIPTQLGLLNDFYSRPAFAKIQASEISALKFLQNNSPQDSVIITPPYDRYLGVKDPTLPIWAWSDTAYISALTGRKTYLSDIEQVDIMGYDFHDRQKTREAIFQEENPDIVANLMRKNNINFIYFPQRIKPKAELKAASFKLFYQNDLIEIWEIK